MIDRRELARWLREMTGDYETETPKWIALRAAAALAAVQRIVRRKADRERGFEDCRACEALGYMGSALRCAEHRATKSEGT